MRFPILPTLVVAAAVATMIALGIWQLQRADEKARIIAGYTQAQTMPALDLDPLLARGANPMPPLAFRRVLVTCTARDVEPALRGGRSEDGAGGYSYFVPCRPGAPGLAGRIQVNAGWSAMPDGDLRVSASGLVAGRLGAVADGRPIILTAASASPPLVPSAAPSVAEISDNHLFYALQWFFFAVAAGLIYVLALRLRSRQKLPPRG